MENLPDELLEKIFSYCRLYDLIWTVSYVNSRWREVSNRSVFWKNRVYRPGWNTSVKVLVNVLCRCPNIRGLDLRNIKLDEEVLEKLICYCSELTQLFVYQYLSREDLQLIQKNYPKLEYLGLWDTIFLEPENVEIIAKFMNLKAFSTRSAFHWPPSHVCLKAISDGCPKLECLDIGDVELDVDDLKYFVSKKKTTLRSLTISCFVNYLDSTCTIPLVSKCMFLETLRIHRMCMNDWSSLTQSLAKMKHLRSLIWQCFDIFEEIGIPTLFGNNNLSCLVRLEFCTFVLYNDEATKIIVANCPNLEGLHLKDCEEFTDESLKMIVNIKNLKEIGISGNNLITDDGMKNLLKAQNLEYLLLGGCSELTDQTLIMITDISHLKILQFEYENLGNFPWHLVPVKLKYLTELNIYQCSYLNLVALKQAVEIMSHLILYVDMASQKHAGYLNDQFEKFHY